jgi:hypothetical protein
MKHPKIKCINFNNNISTFLYILNAFPLCNLLPFMKNSDIIILSLTYSEGRIFYEEAFVFSFGFIFYGISQLFGVGEKSGYKY